MRELTDRELLLAGRRARIAESRANGERWLCFVEFYRRRLATEQQRREVSAHFALTARQETVVEIGSLWGLDASRVRKELNVALHLCEHAEEIWQMCLTGQLDGYRASLVADAGRQRLDSAEEIARFMTQMLKFLRKHLRGVDGEDDAGLLVTCTIRQLRNAIDYAIRKLQPARSEEQFRTAYDARTAYARDDEPGMGWLSVNGRIDQVRLADHRLTLAARSRRKEGDERTIAQLKADLALDLLIGKPDVASVPTYARPIINLTVPIQTVMGLADDPGVLSGGTVVPASLARMIAHEPGGTWHRMLTDEAGHVVELSTRSYQPTGPIWRHVVAEHSTCFRPGCDAPSTQGDLDHRIAWPLGPTDTGNLWPGCRTDHRTKHAPGFSIEQAEDGSYCLRTAAGFSHPIPRSTHPFSDDFSWPDLADGFQFGAAELRQAIEGMRDWSDLMRPRSPEIHWEDDFDEALTEQEWDALYGRRVA
ncbi:MAG TPA: HNH endonuclease signature motif containing protein [Marmoricola sp.]|nr:HNH endonuclease signature motif containing protein [Marmoricola sp.]